MTQPARFYTPRTPAQPMMYRQGVVLTWDPTDASNTVQVDGTVFTNLPIFNTNEALQLVPGAVVGIVDIGTTWAILGRMTIPGTAEAASALSAISTHSERIEAFESTTSATFTDLTTLGPTVTITVPRSGRVLCLLSAHIGWNPTNAGGGDVGIQVTGANSISAGDGAILTHNQAMSGVVTSSVILRSAVSFVYDGLNPGVTTFQAKYASEYSPTAAEFLDRIIVLMPL